jgi:prolyl-tRNA synthetase
VVIVPIYKTDEQFSQITEKATIIKRQLEAKGLSVKYDNRDTHKPGWKFAEYELKGFPVRIAIGPRDVENNTVEIARRDTLEKQTIGMDGIDEVIVKLLDDIQSNIYNKALKFREENTRIVDSWDEFKAILDSKGGFILAHWDGTSETELKIKEETKATIRCIPLDNKEEPGKCIYSGKPSTQRVIFARSY